MPSFELGPRACPVADAPQAAILTPTTDRSGHYFVIQANVRNSTKKKAPPIQIHTLPIPLDSKPLSTHGTQKAALGT
jgi:hypothetical protein